MVSSDKIRKRWSDEVAPCSRLRAAARGPASTPAFDIPVCGLSGLVGPVARTRSSVWPSRRISVATPRKQVINRPRAGHRDVDSMDGETDAPGTPEGSSDPEQSASGFDRRLLSDLTVNVIPIGIIVALTVVMVVFSPGGAGKSVLLFHGALIVGVVGVSVVAGWAVGRLGSPLEGRRGETRRYGARRVGGIGRDRRLPEGVRRISVRTPTRREREQTTVAKRLFDGETTHADSQGKCRARRRRRGPRTGPQGCHPSRILPTQTAVLFTRS